jgi:antitoxin HigA-1
MVRIPTHAPPTHPGEMLLEEFLRPGGVSQKEFAGRAGISAVRLNQIIRGRRGVTPDTALRFARVLGTSAEFWLNLQLGWDLYHAVHSPAADEIRRLRPMKLAAAGRGSG